MRPVKLLQEHRIQVGRQIRKARRTAGLSHDRLAERVGSSRQHLIKLEKGMHLPGPRLLEAIARETERPLEFFESDDDEESEPVTFYMHDALRAMVLHAIEEHERAKRPVRPAHPADVAALQGRRYHEKGVAA